MSTVSDSLSRSAHCHPALERDTKDLANLLVHGYGQIPHREGGPGQRPGPAPLFCFCACKTPNVFRADAASRKESEVMRGA